MKALIESGVKVKGAEVIEKKKYTSEVNERNGSIKAMKEKIRALRADEIEVRVSQVTSKGCQLLLYKDARCDKRILDEVYGTYELD